MPARAGGAALCARPGERRQARGPSPDRDQEPGLLRDLGRGLLLRLDLG